MLLSRRTVASLRGSPTLPCWKLFELSCFGSRLVFLGSFLVRSEGRFFAPTCLGSVTPRADAVKDGRRSKRAAGSGVGRPRLDGGEHGVTLREVGTLTNLDALRGVTRDASRDVERRPIIIPRSGYPLVWNGSGRIPWCAQFHCYLRERVWSPTPALLLGLGPCGRPHFAFSPCHAKPGQELFDRWRGWDRCQPERAVGDFDELLLRCPHLAQQAHRIEGGVQARHSAADLFRGSWISQQPLTGGGWRMIALAHQRPLPLLLGQLERRLKKVHE